MIFAASTKTPVSGGFVEAFSAFKAAFTEFAEVLTVKTHVTRRFFRQISFSK